MSYSDYIASFMITDEEIATEGYNHDTKKAIKANEKRRQIIEFKKTIGKKIRLGKKQKDVALLKDAIRELDKTRDLVNSFKTEIAMLDEPDSFVQKAAGWFTPIFEFKLPEVESKSHGDVSTHTRYHDKYSDSTDSSVKRRYQYRLNLVLKYIDDYRKRVEDLIRKYSGEEVGPDRGIQAQSTTIVNDRERSGITII